MRVANDGVGKNWRSRARTTRNGCCASHAASPSWCVVKTVASADGSRRQSSWRYDWIPPIFGGKSLVTSRPVTAARSRQGGRLDGRRPHLRDRRHVARLVLREPAAQEDERERGEAGRCAERARVARERCDAAEHDARRPAGEVEERA